MDVDVVLSFVLFDSVFRKESLVSIVNGQPSLILVRQELTNVFWSCDLEDLGEQEFI
jgi:hypothetical protein